jgi:hypothetical protein
MIDVESLAVGDYAALLLATDGYFRIAQGLFSITAPSPPVGCYTGSGADYAGGAATTVSGRTCQAWALDSPQSHSFNSLPSNYCRNPDGEPSPWCYTTDPAVRWELCDVASCDTPITVMVYSSGTTVYQSPSATGMTTAITSGEIYSVQVEVLRNDLGSASERVTSIYIDGMDLGGCNPDGGDYDCTFFDCASQLTGSTVTAQNYGVMELAIDVTGHSVRVAPRSISPHASAMQRAR